MIRHHVISSVWTIGAIIALNINCKNRSPPIRDQFAAIF
jgi:hypothetical protein